MAIILKTPQDYLQLLYGVLDSVSGMIITSHLDADIGKGERMFGSEEHMELCAVQTHLLKTCVVLSTAPRTTSVYLHEVCRSKRVLEHLQRHGVNTLAELCRLDVNASRLLLDEAGTGKEKQWHMYLFVRYA